MEYSSAGEASGSNMDPTVDDTIAEVQDADAVEKPATNGTPPTNGSHPVVESDVPGTSSTEPDSRPSVLIIGGLGMNQEQLVRAFEDQPADMKQATSAASLPTIFTRISSPRPCD